MTFSRAPLPSHSTALPDQELSDRQTTAPLDTRQTTILWEEDGLQTTDEIPIIGKRDRPESAVSSQGSRPPSGVMVTAANALSSKKDASKILSYMKKNTYDDTGRFCFLSKVLFMK